MDCVITEDSMNIIDLIVQQTPEERQALFDEFIKLLNQKREYVDIPERIVVLLAKYS